MSVKRIPIAGGKLIGYRKGSRLWLFARQGYQPSRWLILKREGFSGSGLKQDSAFMVTNSLDHEQLRALARYLGEAHSRSKTSLRERITRRIQSGRVKVYRLNKTLQTRLLDPQDPLLIESRASQHAPGTVEAQRHALSEALGKSIAARWVEKDQKDLRHFDRHFLMRGMIETADSVMVIPNLAIDTVKGLWEIASFTVNRVGEQWSVDLRWIGNIATADIEAIKAQLQEKEINAAENIESIDGLIKQLRAGLFIFEQLKADKIAGQLLYDYLDSLQESQPYREQQTASLRIGAEILLLLGSAGLGAAGKAGRIANKGNKAKLVGMFSAEAVEAMTKLAATLKHQDALKAKAASEAAMAGRPVKPLQIPDYAKKDVELEPKPGLSATGQGGKIAGSGVLGGKNTKPLSPRAKHGENGRLESVFTKVEKHHIGTGTQTTAEAREYVRVLGKQDLRGSNLDLT